MALDKNAITKEAQKFAAKGQFDKAIAEWKKLVRESPNDANLYNTIGDLCLKKDSKSEAVDAYKRAADILAEDGFTSKAIALYKKVLNIDPHKVEAHLALGDLNAEKGLTGNALESYKVVADHYKQNNKTSEALGIYQKMADLNPANVAFRIKLGDMYTKEKMVPQATKAYLEAANIHMAKDAFNDARQLFEKILALDPNNKEVYHKAGIVYFKEEKYVEACKALKPAFENDPSNQELADIYLEALTKAGKPAEAEEAFRTILDQDPARMEVREKLCQLYLANKNYEKAVVEIAIIADARVESGAIDAAEDLLRAFVVECPDFPHGRRKLAEFYASRGRPEEAVSELLQAADILTRDGDKTRAKATLKRALEMAPGMPEAIDRLNRLEAPAAKAAPPRPAEPTFAEPEPELIREPMVEPVEELPAAPEPAAAVAQPETASAPIREEDPEVREALTEVDVLLKYGLAPKATEQLEALASRFPENPSIRLRLRDLYLDQGNPDKAVRHALLAVALFTKFGRPDLADAALTTTRDMAPDHPAIIARMGRAAAAAAPPQPTPAAVEPPSEPLFETVREATPPPDTLVQPEWQPQEYVPERTVEHVDAGTPAQAGEPAFDMFSGDMPPAEETTPGQPSATRAEEPEPSPVAEEAPIAAAEPSAAAPERTYEPAPVPEAPIPAQTAGPDVNEIWAEAEFYFQQGLFDEAKKHYAKIIQLTPSDKRAISRLAEISREEEETREFSKLADAVDELEGAAATETAPGEMTMTTSDEEAVRSLMQEIQQLKQGESPKPAPATPPRRPAKPVEETAPPPARPARKPAPPVEEPEAEVAPAPRRPAPKPRPEPQVVAEAKTVPPPAPVPPARTPEPPRIVAESVSTSFTPSRPVHRPAEEEFFDLGEELKADARAAEPLQSESSSDDFFDLAAELRDELSSITVPARSAVPAEEQSLDDIFEEFKKGVEQQAVKEDADTHYNLGVAYKEMGLLDDAISEFIMTPENESKFIQSRYMLGLCYMEKGEYRNAIGEIQNALDYSDAMGAEGLSSMEMRYDLGLAYQGAGNSESAAKEFQTVYNEDSTYRDVSLKIKELKKGASISIDRLKDDIEKEISSKFLVEGERIQREEKTRRNERIKN